VRIAGDASPSIVVRRSRRSRLRHDLEERVSVETRDVELSFLPQRGRPATSAGLSRVRVGLLGFGRVGQAVAVRAVAERDRLRAAGVDLSCVGALVRDPAKPRGGPRLALSREAGEVIRSGVDVVVEVLGGCEPARTLVAAALQRGIPVVTANKSLVANHGRELQVLARACSTTLSFDAAVLAGVPFLGSLSRRPIAAGARRIEGIINGTSHFILSGMSRGVAFRAALDEAIAQGFAEPDSAADTSGRDAAEKLTILLHLAGRPAVAVDSVPCASLDDLDPHDLAGARELGGVIKPIALATLDGPAPEAWSGPAFVPQAHPFARLEGVENALRLTDPRGRTVTFAGPGAGPDVTAATILDDVVECLGHRPSLGTRELYRQSPASRIADPARISPPAGSWFLGLDGGDLAVCDVVSILQGRQVPPHQAVKCGKRIGVLTRTVAWPLVDETVTALRRVGIPAVALPVLGSDD
jgi:homoserine dehydrogenase